MSQHLPNWFGWAGWAIAAVATILNLIVVEFETRRLGKVFRSQYREQVRAVRKTYQLNKAREEFERALAECKLAEPADLEGTVEIIIPSCYDPNEVRDPDYYNRRRG